MIADKKIIKGKENLISLNLKTLIGAFAILLNKLNSKELQNIIYFDERGIKAYAISINPSLRIKSFIENFDSYCEIRKKDTLENEYYDGGIGKYNSFKKLSLNKESLVLILDSDKKNENWKICFTGTNPYIEYMSERMFCIQEHIDSTDTIASLSIMGEHEKNIIDDYQSIHVRKGNSTLFFRLVESSAEKYPERTAIVCGDKSITYRELNEKSNQLAQYIDSYYGDNKLIGIFMSRSINYYIAILAVLKSGNAYVPLDADTLNPSYDSYPEKRLEFMISDCNMELILLEKKDICNIMSLNIDCISLDEFNYSSFSMENRERNTEKSDIMYGIYTSGSTGEPKLALVKYSNISNLFEGLKERVLNNLENQPVVYSQNAPFGFDASVQQFIALTEGNTICIIPEKTRNSVYRMISYIAKHKIEVFDCTPPQLSVLLDNGLYKKCMEHLKIVLVGGDVVSDELWNRLSQEKEIKTFNVYGPTECTVDTAICRIDNENPPSIGRPLCNCGVYIWDENRKNVPIGAKGEIYIRGEGICKGYLNRDELNATSFLTETNIDGTVRERLYRTGDFGAFLPNGNISFLGRKDRQVKIRSHRIELSEIENKLLLYSRVRDGIVVERAHKGHSCLVAYVILEDDMKNLSGTLSEFLNQFLPHYMIPNYFVQMSAWPLTSNGKIDEDSLPFTEQTILENKEKNSQTGKVELDVSRIMRELLGIMEIDNYDSFIALGGDSLLVMTLLAKIMEKYDVEIDFADFFENPTLNFIVKRICAESEK